MPAGYSLEQTRCLGLLVQHLDAACTEVAAVAHQAESHGLERANVHGAHLGTISINIMVALRTRLTGPLFEILELINLYCRGQSTCMVFTG